MKVKASRTQIPETCAEITFVKYQCMVTNERQLSKRKNGYKCLNNTTSKNIGEIERFYV